MLHLLKNIYSNTVIKEKIAFPYDRLGMGWRVGMGRGRECSKDLGTQTYCPNPFSEGHTGAISRFCLPCNFFFYFISIWDKAGVAPSQLCPILQPVYFVLIEFLGHTGA